MQITGYTCFSDDKVAILSVIFGEQLAPHRYWKDLQRRSD